MSKNIVENIIDVMARYERILDKMDSKEITLDESPYDVYVHAVSDMYTALTETEDSREIDKKLRRKVADLRFTGK